MIPNWPLGRIPSQIVHMFESASDFARTPLASKSAKLSSLHSNIKIFLHVVCYTGLAN